MHHTCIVNHLTDGDGTVIWSIGLAVNGRSPSTRTTTRRRVDVLVTTASPDDAGTASRARLPSVGSFQAGRNRTILPSLPPAANRSYAASASVIGYVAAMGTVTGPDATTGGPAARLGGGLALLLERPGAQRRPVDPAPLRHEREEIELTSPAATPMMEIRPPVARPSRSAAKLGAPTRSSTTSKGPCSERSASANDGHVATGAPDPLDLTPQIGVPDRRRDVGAGEGGELDSAIPTPPAAPWISTRSPSVSPHWVNSASCAVANTSRKPPAYGQGIERSRDRGALVQRAELGLRRRRRRP